jgi:hypothetical protein
MWNTTSIGYENTLRVGFKPLNHMNATRRRHHDHYVFLAKVIYSVDVSSVHRLSVSCRPYLDFVFAIDLVVVKCVLRDRRAGVVQVLHERNVLLRRDKTDFVQIRRPASVVSMIVATALVARKRTG